MEQTQGGIKNEMDKTNFSRVMGRKSVFSGYNKAAQVLQTSVLQKEAETSFANQMWR